MTGPELRDAIRTLGWTQRRAAMRLGRGEATVRRWIAGTVPIPPDVAAWCRAAAAWHRAHPCPGALKSPATVARVSR